MPRSTADNCGLILPYVSKELERPSSAVSYRQRMGAIPSACPCANPSKPAHAHIVLRLHSHVMGVALPRRVR